ncbi:dnaJ homolog subfamily C member 25 homolog [Octopus sinensis]|uniref:DnaJ homolog subfamily C member 25 homolog n=1 Tax=Octopus sinensis TaxID=2607531 RepID=A0A6P7SEV6_9MOLL|nr:dnaJ homolog subfamily C member 25 homolog [Octopus sinensis]
MLLENDIIGSKVAAEPVATVSPEKLNCQISHIYFRVCLAKLTSLGDAVKQHPHRMNSVKNETMRKEEVKATATLVYQKITTSYDILKHDEHRNDSSYMVAHPEEYYLDYFYFYRTLVPKVDVEIVIAVTVSVASVIQYLNAWEGNITVVKMLRTQDDELTFKSRDNVRANALPELKSSEHYCYSSINP